MKTFQDEVTDKRTGLTTTVLVEWQHNPFTSQSDYRVKNGSDIITRYVPSKDLERLEAKIRGLSMELKHEERIESLNKILCRSYTN